MTMNRCFLFLLLLYSILLNKSVEHFQNVTIQHLCEDQILLVKCPKDNQTIEIIRSMYGRTSQRLCNGNLTNSVFYKTCANIEQSTLLLKNRCHGRSSCELRVNSKLFHDPCGANIRKHFEIHYRCRNSDDFCLPMLLNCSKNKDLICVDRLRQIYSCHCPSTICKYKQENHQLIGFVEEQCSSEYIHGIHWPKTLVNKGHHVSCPYPCQGQIFRFCQTDGRWSKLNYTDCRCPIEIQPTGQYVLKENQFSCDSWLNEWFQSMENTCVSNLFREISSMEIGSHWSNCLIGAFRKLSWTNCSPFAFQFENFTFQLVLEEKRKVSRFDLPSSQIEIEGSTSTSLLIEENRTSFLFIPKMVPSEAKQNGEMTITFRHEINDFLHQCRVYRSNKIEKLFDSTESFSVCRSICFNESLTICRCPVFDQSSRFVLNLDSSNDEIRVENEIENLCLDDPLKKIDFYLKKILDEPNRISFVEKLFRFVDRRAFSPKISAETFSQLVERLDSIAFYLMKNAKNFFSVAENFEIFVNKFPTESNEKFVDAQIEPEDRWAFLTISSEIELNESIRLNSRIVRLAKNSTFDEIDVQFQNLKTVNLSAERSVCVSWSNEWIVEFFKVRRENSTHAVCSCRIDSNCAVRVENYVERKVQWFPSFTTIGSFVSILFLIATFFLLFFQRRKLKIDDELRIVRNFLHFHQTFCLFFGQICYSIALEEILSNFFCRIVSIGLHYFLLAAFSWMFVDGVELIIALKYSLKSDRIRLSAYSLYAYGFPLLIVLLSVFLSTEENTFQRSCWLSHDEGFLWAFAIPFVLLISVFIAFFLFYLSTCCENYPEIVEFDRIRKLLRNQSLFSICFASSWFVGLFFFNPSSNDLFLSTSFKSINNFQSISILPFFFLSFVRRKKMTNYNSPSTYNNSSDSRKEIFSPTTGDYLSNFPNQMSSFRLNKPMIVEHEEKLLRRNQIDEHQYYEIG